MNAATTAATAKMPAIAATTINTMRVYDHGALPVPQPRRARCYTVRVTSVARQLLDQLLVLPDEDRAELAAELIASLDGPQDPDWESAWASELDRRSAAADASGVPAEEWSVVRDAILAELAHR